MIHIEQITYSYGRRKAPVLADFSLNIEQGKIYGLLGKNGTGKSTLLYLICGLLHAQKGKVTFDGIDVTLRRPEVLQEMYLVPEELDLPNISLAQYVRLNAPFYPRFSQERLEACLKDFEMSSDVRLGSLSMGQKKKVYVSFALATGVRFLLMDEPTNGLDIPSKALFRQVVARHMSEDSTLLVSTHQVRDVETILDHIIILEKSNVLLNASIADICAAVRFEERAMGEPLDDVLFMQPSMRGNMVVVPNNDPDSETSVDLELLFNCVEAGKFPSISQK